MSQLFGIIYRIRYFFIFLILQIFCFYLIGKNNVYWDVTLFNSTNSVVSKTLKTTQNIHEFINLGEINDQLVLENKALRTELTIKRELEGIKGSGYKVDSSVAKRFDYIVAKVIKSTQNLTDNYITIDKGTLDGLKPGMGVICPQGVVGQIMSCNEHYSRISSILHSKFSVSSEIFNKNLKKDNLTALGIAKWNGSNPSIIELTTVDRFKPVFKGDSVMTSMQNVIFPPKIMVGRISKIGSNQADAFLDINVKLSTDFGSLLYVYVVNNKLSSTETELEKNDIK